MDGNFKYLKTKKLKAKEKEDNFYFFCQKLLGKPCWQQEMNSQKGISVCKSCELACDLFNHDRKI